MAARRFLYIFALLIVLAIAAGFAYRLFGTELLRYAMVPDVSFEESPAAPPTFYDRPDAWIARPGVPSAAANWTPQGYSVAPRPAVAVFYVHPTTYLKSDRWNAAIDLEDEGARYRQDVFVKSQASVFNGIGEIWAPKYRQATFGAFLSLDHPDAARALALAYTDVENAFETFLASIPEDRKIVLAGHSQGSLHLTQLLARRIAGTPVEDRIVAAYLAGWPISLESDLPALGLPACRAPRQTGCLLGWQSYAEPAEPELILDVFDATNGLDGKPRTAGALLCTNPLTGGVDEDAPKELNIGTLVPVDDSLSDAVLVPDLVGAACLGRGYLSLGETEIDIGDFVLPGNNYHVYDYALFWANLRADVERRVDAATSGGGDLTMRP